MTKLRGKTVKIKDVAKSYGVHPWTFTRAIRRLEAIKCVDEDHVLV